MGQHDWRLTGQVEYEDTRVWVCERCGGEVIAEGVYETQQPAPNSILNTSTAPEVDYAKPVKRKGRSAHRAYFTCDEHLVHYVSVR